MHEHANAKPAMQDTAASDASDDVNGSESEPAGDEPVKVMSPHTSCPLKLCTQL